MISPGNIAGWAVTVEDDEDAWVHDPATLEWDEETGAPRPWEQTHPQVIVARRGDEVHRYSPSHTAEELESVLRELG